MFQGNDDMKYYGMIAFALTVGFGLITMITGGIGLFITKLYNRHYTLAVSYLFDKHKGQDKCEGVTMRKVELIFISFGYHLTNLIQIMKLFYSLDV